jgi:hypothetical protein
MQIEQSDAALYVVKQAMRVDVCANCPSLLVGLISRDSLAIRCEPLAIGFESARGRVKSDELVLIRNDWTLK